MRNRCGSRLLIAAAVGMLVAACGKVEGTQFAGEPLAVFNGQITSTGGVSAPNGIRLALAWYPRLTGQSAPKGIVTQEVVYQGDFPLTYSFDVYSPPPVDALGVVDEAGAMKAALGLLIAYEDRNGNRLLDTIPVDGAPIDKVLGLSSRWTLNSYAVVYVEGTAGPDAGPELQALVPGFNLIRFVDTEPGAEVVPSSTPIPIALTGEPELDFFVCEAAWGSLVTESLCGIDFEPRQPMLTGSITFSDDAHELSLQVNRDDVDWSALTITVDGKALENTGSALYGLTDETRTLTRPGATHVVVLEIPGEPSHVQVVTMPGDFAIQYPGDGEVLPVGEPITAAWTPSTGAGSYTISLYGDVFEWTSMSITQRHTSFDSGSDVALTPGTATFSVQAVSAGADGIDGIVSHSLELNFVE